MFLYKTESGAGAADKVVNFFQKTKQKCIVICTKIELETGVADYFLKAGVKKFSYNFLKAGVKTS